MGSSSRESRERRVCLGGVQCQSREEDGSRPVHNHLALYFHNSTVDLYRLVVVQVDLHGAWYT